MRIALCDDQQAVAEELGRLIKVFAEENGIQIDFFYFLKPSKLFEYLSVSMEELQLTESISIMRRGILHNILIRDICYFSAAIASIL